MAVEKDLKNNSMSIERPHLLAILFIIFSVVIMTIFVFLIFIAIFLPKLLALTVVQNLFVFCGFGLIISAVSCALLVKIK